MNHTATSEDELLAASLKLASEEGLKSLNIRSIARACGVSVGCVYRYFPSKAELVSAAVGKIWEQIFHMAENAGAQGDFRGAVRWVFSCIRSGCAEYPSFFRQHAGAFAESEKGEGRRAMERCLGHIRAVLLRALEEDPSVRAGVFDRSFTREDFVSFVFDNLISLGVRQADSCEFLLRLIEKLIF